MSEWISVEDHMPDSGVAVLVYRKGKKTNDGPFLAKTRGGDTKPWRYLDGSRCDVTPTHWATLPPVEGLQ